VGFETLGSRGLEAKEFIATIEAKLSNVTEEPRAAAFLKQRISLELQTSDFSSGT
jgi:hypothetical protein